ncbi:tetratricopeptide repeat protein [Croceitalea rosinachiae]|uniref:Tetratricopeptide repeat protein n=1 Tax=Croceitalea rosinachiae TaxID=3075596 RepID=A0ABU3ACI3_9FLAO|nr:tetratricopeptide repeat protein [Croceitalea sp. F388]MDT0607623.1 hypothetical protein [Croceitalea sp. F388]
MKNQNSIIVGLFIFLMVGCKEKTISPPQQKETVSKIKDKIVEATSFGGEKLFQREVDSTKLIKYKKRIDSVHAIGTLTELDYEVLGGYHIELNQYNKAIGVYTEGLEKYPNSYRLLRHRGHRYLNIRKLDKAITDLKKAEGLMNEVSAKDIEYYADGKPKGTFEFWIWYHIGLYHYLNQDFAQAAEAYKKCLSTAITSKNSVGATDWLYNCYQKNGNSKSAMALLETIPKDYDTDHNYVYFKRLMVYKGVLKPEELIAPEKPVSEWNGSEMTCAYGIGSWYLYNGDEATALKYYKNIVKTPFWNSWAFVVTDKELAIRTTKKE